jgi:hypothetical protein
MNWMITYAWEDTDAVKATGESEVKFGDHFVENADTFAEAEKRTLAYMRSSLARQKNKWDDGRIRHDAIWDVSDYAKTVGKFYKHSKIDDTIRKCIPNHVAGTDVHQIAYDDLVVYVNNFLHKQNQPLAAFGPSTLQYRAGLDIVDQILNRGKRTIVADLCPRFGKTTWAAMVASVLKSQLTVVASYVLTSFTSFDKDLSSFEEFADVVRVDTMTDPLYQSRIEDALFTGKKVFAYLSMCNGGQRQSRIDFLFGLSANRLVFVDEADFGVHKPAQVQPLIDARQDNDIVVLMTGTNSERAVADWKVDYIMTATYPEMLVERKLSLKPRKNETRKLNGFKINRKRDLVAVPVEFYQFDLAGIVAYTKKTLGAAFDSDLLSSWSKFAMSPAQGKGFWMNVLGNVFLGLHGCPETSADIQFRPRGLRNAMMFMSGCMTKENLTLTVDFARQALGPGWVVVEMSGETMTGRKAERLVNQAIDEAEKKNQNVLVLSIAMGQRSFSVSRLTEVYLAYDGGEAGATAQKMSRVLTADGGQNKIGRVISLSFDPNRDDKMDSVVLETAQNLKKAYGGNIRDALTVTLEHIDMFAGGRTGRVRIMLDTYLEQLIAFNRLGRVAGRAADLTGVTEEFIRALAACGGQYARVKQTEATLKGRTGVKKNRTTTATPKGASWEKLMSKAREAVTTIVENADVLIDGTQSRDVDAAIATVDADQEYQDSIKKEFRMPWSLVRDCLTEGIINLDFIELSRRSN